MQTTLIVPTKADILKVFKQITSIVRRLKPTDTFYVRDFGTPIDSPIRYSLRDVAKRVVNTWLRTRCDTSLQTALSNAKVHMPYPAKIDTYVFTRQELQEAVRENFRIAEKWIADTAQENRLLLQNALLSRGICIGNLLEQQIALHMRSSVCITSEKVMMPVETAKQIELSRLSVYEMKQRIGLIPFTGEPPMPLKGSLEHALRMAEVHGDTGTALAAVTPEARAAHHSDPLREAEDGSNLWHCEIDSNKWLFEFDVETESLRITRRESYLWGVYRLHAPMVTSADMFELLALGKDASSPPQPPHSTNNATSSRVAVKSKGASAPRSVTAFGSPLPPPLEPRDVRVRVHATSSVMDPDLVMEDRDSTVTFEYQVVIENLSQVAVRVMGRHFEIRDAWNTRKTGTREAPLPRILGCEPVVMPGEAIMYRSHGRISHDGGDMRGGYLVTALPDDLAHYYSYRRSESSGRQPLDMLKFDPQISFIADLAPFKVAPFEQIENMSERMTRNLAEQYGEAVEPSDVAQSDDDDQEGDGDEDEEWQHGN